MSLVVSAALLAALAPTPAATVLRAEWFGASALRCVVEGAAAPAPAPSDAGAGLSLPADSTLEALYASGQTWDAFLGNARARRELWVRNATQVAIPADAVARARTVPGRWRFLVVAVDACSDSVNTIPFLAQLVAASPGLELRIITPDAGRTVTRSRRTPDGRAATPTVIILADDGSEAGCWIERPAALQAAAMAARAGGGTPEFAEQKAAWYAADAGRSTLDELVTLLERAAAGARGCDASGGSEGQVGDTRR